MFHVRTTFLQCRVLFVFPIEGGGTDSSLPFFLSSSLNPKIIFYSPLFFLYFLPVIPYFAFRTPTVTTPVDIPLSDICLHADCFHLKLVIYYPCDFTNLGNI